MVEQDLLRLIEIDKNGRLKHRENTRLEFKQNFSQMDFALYAKTLSAFANNQGGVIIFGIKDKPRELLGMTNDNFVNFDNEKLTEFFNNHFEPQIEFETIECEKFGKKFGTIYVRESNDKPIMCIKNGGKKQDIIEGEIYYRYSGRTQKIRYVDLKKILNDNLELERQKWREHIENIAKIGPKNVKMLDLLRGEIDSGNGKKIVVDKELLKKLNLVVEGKFVEKDGAPTLKLIGQIEGGELITPKLDLQNDFHTTKQLMKKLGLSIHHNYFRGVNVEFKLQSKQEFVQQKRLGKVVVVLYSDLCLDFLKQKNLTDNKLKELCEKHKVFRPKEIQPQ